MSKKRQRKRRDYEGKVVAEKFEYEGEEYDFSLPWNTNIMHNKFKFVNKNSFLDEEAWEEMNDDEDLSAYKTERKLDVFE